MLWPTGAARDAFELHPVAWRFEAGHVAKLELLDNDAPFGRPSNAPFSIIDPRRRRVVVRVDGRRVRVRRHRAVVDLRGKPRKVVRVTIRGRTASGRRVERVRRYRTCTPGNRRTAR